MSVRHFLEGHYISASGVDRTVFSAFKRTLVRDPSISHRKDRQPNITPPSLRCPSCKVAKSSRASLVAVVRERPTPIGHSNSFALQLMAHILQVTPRVHSSSILRLYQVFPPRTSCGLLSLTYLTGLASFVTGSSPAAADQVLSQAKCDFDAFK